jgi:putative transposase
VVTKLVGQVGFVVQPKRWIVERTFRWLNRSRRLAKDYERTIESSEAFIRRVKAVTGVRFCSRTVRASLNLPFLPGI